MDFISGMDFLDKDIKCRLCGTDESRRDGNNDFVWIPDKNRDKKWTGKYLCYNCRYLNNTYCSVCGRKDRLIFSYNNDGLWDGKRVCWMCSKGKNFRSHYSRTDCRFGNLDPKSSVGKGYISEAIVAKFLNIKTCFDITGNFNYPGYDLLEHEDWGLINVKSSTLLIDNVHRFGIRRSIKPDFFFCIGYDENRKHIIAIYIIPNEDFVSKSVGITIPFDSDVWLRWYDFRESDSGIKEWDELFHSLKLDDCSVLRSGKNDIV